MPSDPIADKTYGIPNLRHIAMTDALDWLIPYRTRVGQKTKYG